MLLGQGRQMSLLKNRPSCSPTRFMLKLIYIFNVEKSKPKICATSVIKNLPKDNNRPIGETSPNLVNRDI
jgi:hypothetical protein